MSRRLAYRETSALARQLALTARCMRAGALTKPKTRFDAANAAARGECDDAMGKAKDMRHEFKGGSLFAIDISIDQKMFPLAVLSLGGLKINEANGSVIDAAGQDIPGLYADGRTAIGEASSRYVSGLSLADCVFSGRRAGQAAALKLQSGRAPELGGVEPRQLASVNE